MQRRYMVVGYGTSKEKKKPYSRAYLVKESDKGLFGYLDSKDSYFCEDMRPLGTIITVAVEEV